MKNRKTYINLAEKTLSKKRFIHSINVAEMSEKLAVIYGEDKEKAFIAGILHDIRKEANNSVLLNEVKKSGLSPEQIEIETPKLHHAISGAYFIREHLDIKDDDIILAVRYHTVGAANMTGLQKIIYLADLVSAERDYPDVEKYRALALQNLDKAFLEAIKWHIEDKLNRNLKITINTLNAYNHALL